MKVSIVIVSYKDSDYVISCLRSIRTHLSYEVIVVDNAADFQLRNLLKKTFPKVTYISSPENPGYGAGCNIGAKHAKGEYIFILNPDTLVFKNTIEHLNEFLDKNKQAGIVAPLLLDEQNTVYPIQGTEELTPISAIFSLSFINKKFPKNKIAKKYWLSDWDKSTLKKVAVVPGTAFLIRSSIYNQINGFDPKFFIYYEECDICLRVRQIGYSCYILPSAKLVHFWGKATPNKELNQKRMKTSRDYYMAKHYGKFWSFFVAIICDFSKSSLFSMLK